MKGTATRKRGDAEGIDDTDTFGVLALEGFLPGYGLDTGSVAATYSAPARGNQDLRTWTLRRASGLALRECAPGNLLYANNHKFTPRYFAFPPENGLVFQVDVGSSAVTEVGAAAGGAVQIGATEVLALPISDVTLAHMSTIGDDEEFRFQLSVTVLGTEVGRHSGGQAWTWGNRQLSVRHNVHLRLVNVGPASMVRLGRLGYPICQHCGASRSPFASNAELVSFARFHGEEHHVPTIPAPGGQPGDRHVQPICLHAHVVADVLGIACESNDEAYSLMESLRLGAAEVLDMGVDDLQVLVIGRPGSTAVDALLVDPMPGGSGLLQQLVTRWSEVIAAALRIVDECASRCPRSCIDCLQHFRNAFYHRHLDRMLAKERIETLGNALVLSNEIPERMPAPQAANGPVGESERVFQDILHRENFPPPEYNRRIDLGGRYGGTIPDAFYEVPRQRSAGVCVYVDGMSRTIHGDPERGRIDTHIHEELEIMDFRVFRITATELGDPDAVRRLMRRLGAVLQRAPVGEGQVP